MGVPFEIPLFRWSRTVAGDISASQYCGLIASGDNVVVATAGARIVGVLQDKPSVAGAAAKIQTYGISKIKLGGTVTAAMSLAVNASGQFVQATGSAAVVGVCLVGGDSGEIGCAILGTSVAADPSSTFLILQDFDVSNTTSGWLVAPVAGNIARVRTVVTTVLAAAAEPGAVAVELATVLVVGSGVTIAAEAAVGDTDDSGAITPGGTTAVAAGDAIEITSDGVPTSGAVTVLVEIAPS